jgi:DNA excision repair protein ERCC-6
MRTPHRLLLSGTPIQNDLRELWSLFDFVFPGRLGTLPAFEAEFADPIKRGGYSNASPMQVQLAYRCALMLRDLINPYLLRRQKKDIKEVSRMPGKTEQVLFCRLSSRQRALYEAFIRSDLVMSVLRGSSQLLGAVTTLRKICNHPDLVCGSDQSSFESFVRNGFVGDDSLMGESSDEDDDIDISESMVERAGKLHVLAKILPLWKEQGHRVLIFCQWRKMLNIIQRFTELQGWKFARLDGNTNVASRQRLVDTFNTDESYFGMLMTTRTGGVGLVRVDAIL